MALLLAALVLLPFAARAAAGAASPRWGSELWSTGVRANSCFRCRSRRDDTELVQADDTVSSREPKPNLTYSPSDTKEGGRDRACLRCPVAPASYDSTKDIEALTPDCFQRTVVILTRSTLR
jgi:hypothetical protein